MEQSGIGILYRLNREEQQKLIEYLQSGKGIVGETIELTITDNYNRFDLGTAVARIERWNPPPSSRAVKTLEPESTTVSELIARLKLEITNLRLKLETTKAELRLRTDKVLRDEPALVSDPPEPRER